MNNGLSAARDFHRSAFWFAGWCGGNNDCSAHFKQQNQSRTVYRAWFFCCRLFLSSFAVGITNPAAILTFLFAFSYFGISVDVGLLQGVMLVCGVFAGTYIWWGTLTAVTNIIKKNTFYPLRQKTKMAWTLVRSAVLAGD